MNTNHCLRVSLSCLFFWHLVGALVAIQARQIGQKDSSRVAGSKNACTNAEPKTFSVKYKDRYFFGETPSITISITNTSRSAQTVKEAEHQKFSLEMTGIFQNDAGQHKKNVIYDGSWDIPKEPMRFPKPGEMHVFEALRKREPKFVKLAPGESTTLELDLSKTFGSYLGVSKYKLIVKSDDGQKVVKEFEVYFDDEKSVAFLAGYLKSDSESERVWAVYRLAEFNKEKLIVVLEELVKSGNEKQRAFAIGILGRIKAGHFGPDPALKSKQRLK